MSTQGSGSSLDDRGSKILELGRGGGGPGRAVAIALLSTLVFVVVIGVAITQSSGWEDVKTTFFNWGVFKDSFPEIASAFKLNVKIFCIAEVFILVFALLLAVLRSLRGPAFFPLRALAIVYADFFRGVPTILVIALLGFGAPALALNGVPTSRVFWATVGLILVYSGYVAEVRPQTWASANIDARLPMFGCDANTTDATTCFQQQQAGADVFPQAKDTPELREEIGDSPISF